MLNRDKTCGVDGCGLPVRCTGLCAIHYDRRRDHGDAADMAPDRMRLPHRPLDETFDRTAGPDGCLLEAT